MNHKKELLRGLWVMHGLLRGLGLKIGSALRFRVRILGLNQGLGFRD